MEVFLHGVLGVFSYKDAKQYNAFLNICTAADDMPETFSLWRKKLQRMIKDVERTGRTVVHIYCTPAEFQAWCEAHHKPLDSPSRALFAQEKLKATHKVPRSLEAAIHDVGVGSQ